MGVPSVAFFSSRLLLANIPIELKPSVKSTDSNLCDLGTHSSEREHQRTCKSAHQSPSKADTAFMVLFLFYIFANLIFGSVQTNKKGGCLRATPHFARNLHNYF